MDQNYLPVAHKICQAIGGSNGGPQNPPFVHTGGTVDYIIPPRVTRDKQEIDQSTRRPKSLSESPVIHWSTTAE